MTCPEAGQSKRETSPERSLSKPDQHRVRVSLATKENLDVTRFLYTSSRPILPAPVKARADGSAAEKVAEYHAAHVAMEKARISLDTLADNAKAETREKAETAYRDAREACTAAAIRAKAAMKFVPEKGAKLARYLVADDIADAYVAAETPDERAALLAGLKPVTGESPVTPSIYAAQGMREYVEAHTPEGTPASQTLLTWARAGFFIFPSTGSGPSAKKDTRTVEEKAEEAARALFGE